MSTEWGQPHGHQSDKGFKDVVHAWTADKLDTDTLLESVQGWGARYFIALANHHDHFDNFDSTHQPWNSVNVGPRRDLIGEFAVSARKIGLPFGVSSHDDRMIMFYEHAFDADADGSMQGVPYDGNLTKADGIGTWWEGLDPADLYGPPPSRRTPQWEKQMKTAWELRHKELIDRYDPDLLWFDGHGFPYGDHGREVCRHFYANRLTERDTLDNVVIGKMTGEPAVIDDIEKGVALEIRPKVWQGTTAFTAWFYKDDVPSRHDARTLIEVLIDVISKNGNLLLNIEPYGDGSMPPDHVAILDEFGAWVNLHAEAIYGTRPWRVFGDNLGGTIRDRNIDTADLDTVVTDSEQFNERTLISPPYPHDEVRFTVDGDTLFVFVLNPSSGPLRLPALGSNSIPQIATVRLIGSTTPISVEQHETYATIDVPQQRPTERAAVFALDLT